MRSLVSVMVGVSVIAALFASPVIARDPVSLDPMAGFEPHAKLREHRGGVHNASKVEARANALTGAKHWVLLRCQYQTQWGNKPRVQNNETYFNTMFSATSPGLADYWNDSSYNNITISHEIPGGETEYRNLPQANSAYGTQANPDAQIVITDDKFDILHHDCASVWNDAVNFTSGNYYAIIIDQAVGACGVGGFFNGSALDGVSGLTGTLVGTCQDDEGLWAHEMAHAFGLPHSESPNTSGNTLYNTSYDVLSAPCGNDGLWWGGNGVNNPRLDRRFQYGCLPSHLLAAHKNQLGWIPTSRIFRATGGSQTITLERLAQPVSGTNFLMAIIERDKNNYLTVEARFKTGIGGSPTFETGYDENIPGTSAPNDGFLDYTDPCCYEAGQDVTPHAMIVINLVTWDPINGRRIRLQGTDDNGNGWWDDPGTQWRVGETFTYENMSVAVDSMPTQSSFTITINRAPMNCASAPFTDVPTGHPFCKEIQWMAHNQISTGFNDGTYKPANGVSREAMAAFMARTAGANPPACSSAPFNDVPANHPFCKEIKWMKDNNISTGFAGNLYKPSEIVTRQAMSAFMARLAGGTLANCTSAPFNDVSTGHPFCKEIKWMKDNNISTGFPGNLYQPGDPVTRQAMSAFLYRVSGLIAPPV